MTTELQANVLSANTVKRTMPACLLYALVQSMTFMVDSIIAGHFLCTDIIKSIEIERHRLLPIVMLESEKDIAKECSI